MKLFIDPNNFNKKIVVKDEFIHVHTNSKYNINNLEDNCFYSLNLKLNYDIKYNGVLFLYKNNTLLVHKSVYWMDDHSDNDLDIGNYIKSEIDDLFKFDVFRKIPIEDYVSSDYKRY